MTDDSVTTSYAVSCDICQHEINVEFTYTRNVLMTIVPSEWVCTIQDDLESGALKLFWYCPIHNPDTES